MASRSKDSERLATLAQQIADVSAGCVKVVAVLTSLNEDYGRLHSQMAELNDAVDDIEHRLVKIERG